MDREKIKRNIDRNLDKMNDAEIRAIYMVSYHIVKRHNSILPPLSSDCNKVSKKFL